MLSFVSVWATPWRRPSNPNRINPDFTNPVAWYSDNLNITGSPSDYLITVASTALTVLLQTDGTATAAGATFSIEGKQGSGPNDGNQFFVYDLTASSIVVGGNINWATGVWSYSHGTSGVVVTDKGGGWWKIAMSGTPTEGHSIRVYTGFGGGPATGATSVHFRNAKLENGLIAT